MVDPWLPSGELVVEGNHTSWWTRGCPVVNRWLRATTHHGRPVVAQWWTGGWGQPHIMVDPWLPSGELVVEGNHTSWWTRGCLVVNWWLRATTHHVRPVVAQWWTGGWGQPHIMVDLWLPSGERVVEVNLRSTTYTGSSVSNYHSDHRNDASSSFCHKREVNLWHSLVRRGHLKVLFSGRRNRS